jgi:hypothetical protein
MAAVGRYTVADREQLPVGATSFRPVNARGYPNSASTPSERPAPAAHPTSHFLPCVCAPLCQPSQQRNRHSLSYSVLMP